MCKYILGIYYINIYIQLLIREAKKICLLPKNFYTINSDNKSNVRFRNIS